MDNLVRIFDFFEEFFETYPFTQEFILVFLSVILGGVCTVFVNKGAIRKQYNFNMQHRILEDTLKQGNELQAGLEKLEIVFSFIGKSTIDFIDDISRVESMTLNLNKNLLANRKFVYKYISAISVEKSAQIVVDFNKTMFRIGDRGFPDFRVIEVVNSEELSKLRRLVNDVRNLNSNLTESLEKMICPGIIAKLSRRIRPVILLIGEICAMVYIYLKNMRKSNIKDK